MVNSNIATLNELLPSTDTPLEVLKITTALEDLFFRVKAYESAVREEAAMEQAAAAAGSVQNSSVQHAKEEKLRLPTILIFMFDGQITEFPAWKSLYLELIHNSELSDIQKFTYLKSYLSGPALASINSIKFCSQNYSLAFKALQERYSKKRLLASHHINTIFLHFQSLTNDNVSRLRAFLDNYHIPVQ